MTKLMQWLLGGFTFLSLWVPLVLNTFHLKIVQDHKQVVLCLPLIIIGVFGVYAATVVLWRVYTFNDCEDAAKELQQEIIQAKEDLAKKGFVFERSKKND